MATPTFTNLDIGLPGGALNPDHARTLCSVEIGPVQVARSTFAFPGLPTTFKVAMGPQSRAVGWTITLRCDNLTTLNTVETAIDNLVKSGAAGTLADSQGNTYCNAIVRGYQPQRGYDVIRSGEMDGWARKAGLITFEVLTP